MSLISVAVDARVPRNALRNRQNYNVELIIGFLELPRARICAILLGGFNNRATPLRNEPSPAEDLRFVLLLICLEIHIAIRWFETMTF